MKHFTILNRQGLLTHSYGKAVPISSKGAAALDGRQREAESYQKIAASGAGNGTRASPSAT